MLGFRRFKRLVVLFCFVFCLFVCIFDVVLLIFKQNMVFVKYFLCLSSPSWNK